MKVAAVSMMRDEEDVARHVVEHLTEEGFDCIIVADNLSKDGTRDALEDARRNGCPLEVVEDGEVGYHQAEKMTHLAALAAERGCEWVVPFDADEIWYVRGWHLAQELRELPEDVHVVGATLWNHFCTALDLDDPVPFRSMVYRQAKPGAMQKVAFRWHPNVKIDQGNHGVSRDDQPVHVDTRLPIEVRHFPYRSPEHMERKARNGAEAYAATDLPAHVGAHWRQYGELIDRLGPTAIHDVFREHFWFLSPTDSGLILDPAPFMRWSQ